MAAVWRKACGGGKDRHPGPGVSTPGRVLGTDVGSVLLERSMKLEGEAGVRTKGEATFQNLLCRIEGTEIGVGLHGHCRCFGVVFNGGKVNSGHLLTIWPLVKAFEYTKKSCWPLTFVCKF